MKRGFVTVAIVTALVLAGALAATAAPTYVGAAKCKMCHKVEYDSWVAVGTHAKALDGAKASKTTPYGPACLGCHATNNSDATMGVECEACHGPGSDYKAMSIMKDQAKAVAAGLVLPSQAMCDRCHDGKDHHKKVDIKTAKVHDKKVKP